MAVLACGVFCAGWTVRLWDLASRLFDRQPDGPDRDGIGACGRGGRVGLVGRERGHTAPAKEAAHRAAEEDPETEMNLPQGLV